MNPFPSRTNGRVNIMVPNIDARFALSDHIPINQTSSFRDAMTGNWYDTDLSTAFFSSPNMKIIQNGIRAGVYNKSNGQYVIGEQNGDELKIVMRSIFLQYAKNLPTHIADQINELNQIVFNRRNNILCILSRIENMKYLNVIVNTIKTDILSVR